MLPIDSQRTPLRSVKRIDKLTKAQEAAMPAFRDKWIEIGLRTGPADRPAFERHVTECYRAAGLEPPKRVVWVQSPLVLAFAAPTAALALEWRKLADARPDVRAVFLARLAGVSAPVRGAMEGAVRGAVEGAVEGAVDGAVGGAVRDAVRGAVLLRQAVLEAIRRAWYYRFGGQFWPGWPSWRMFVLDECGLDIGDKLDAAARAYAGTVESACWWWPHKDFVMVCERPTHIDRDEQGRLL